jgi:2-oxoglutarate dehydrogenase E2 component (dihydrolipoamide succinyltransferase)
MNHVPIIMPQMGQSVAEGEIVRWHKDVGEAIANDEVVVEIETDKTRVEVESPASGTLASCLKQAGEIAAAGEVIGMIESADEVEPAVPAPPSAPVAAQRPHAGGDDDAVTVSTQAPSWDGAASLPLIDRDYYSPAVLRLALHNNLSLKDLKAIAGSGRGGRVTRNDILAYLARRPSEAAPPGTEAVEAEYRDLGKVVPMTAIRRTIADHMVQSIRQSAHVTMVHAVDMTHIVALRNEYKQRFEERHGAKLTYTAVLIFVTARVLRDFPLINALVRDTTIVQRNEINIGCAVAVSDESLVVPVVRHADRLSLPEIARELARLIALAQSKELDRKAVEGGTFTISNFGAFGSLIGTPIIHQPQVAILGMGTVFKTPAVVGDKIRVRERLYLSFSFDHRVIDGAQAGRFLNAIQRTAEGVTAEELDLADL